MVIRLRLLSLATIAFGFCVANASYGGSVWLPGVGGVANVPTRSLLESKFANVVRQQYDFSCGSAALATLLTFHYGRDTAEQDAFNSMYAAGDKEKIARAGFSLLDMKQYLESIGYQADGYEASLHKLESVGVPAIALVNHRGYRHFVVVKGVQGNEVLIGDPALGMKYMSRAQFEETWDNGVLFIIKNKPAIGKSHFNIAAEWQALARAPLGPELSADSLADLTIDLPRLGEF